MVGSVAMALHGEIRATKDIDVLVPRDLDNMKRLLDALGELPMGLARELDAATETRRAITIIGDDPRVDVLKGAGGLAYRQAKHSKKTARIRGVEVPYAGLQELIQSKTERDQDQVDKKKLTRLLEAQTRTPDAVGERRLARRPGRRGRRRSPKRGEARLRVFFGLKTIRRRIQNEWVEPPPPESHAETALP